MLEVTSADAIGLKAGDKVMLKSGGPKMIINRVFGEQNVECVWFVNETMLNKGEFHPAALFLVREAIEEALPGE